MSKLSLGVQRAAKATAEVVAVPPILPTSRARLTDNAVEFPTDFAEGEWEQFGRAVGKMGTAKMWWLGDWYAQGERHGWGRLKDAARITGEKPSTIKAANWVVTKVVDRLTTLSWTHHHAVAKLEASEQRLWLERAAVGEDGVSWTVRRLKDEIRLSREAGPLSPAEEVLLDRARSGVTVVANLRSNPALVGAATAEGLFVRIDRRTEWGNPFSIPGDGDREAVLQAFADHYLPLKPSLLGRLPELRGKVLGCWCAPERCHGDVLREAAEA